MLFLAFIFTGMDKPVWFRKKVHLKELNCLLVGKTSGLGVVLREQDDSDSPNNGIKMPKNGDIKMLLLGILNAKSVL